MMLNSNLLLCISILYTAAPARASGVRASAAARASAGPAPARARALAGHDHAHPVCDEIYRSTVGRHAGRRGAAAVSGVPGERMAGLVEEVTWYLFGSSPYSPDIRSIHFTKKLLSTLRPGRILDRDGQRCCGIARHPVEIAAPGLRKAGQARTLA